jgi:hypothetical protein
VTGHAKEADPGAWIGLSLRDTGPYQCWVPSGYGAYAEIIHDREANAPPSALSQDDLRLLVNVLRRHTATPDDCFFGQWTVWGYLPRPTRTWTFADGIAYAREPEPRVEQTDLRALDEPLHLATDYTYRLFSGPLDAAQMVGHWPNEHLFDAHAPDLIWPQDRAWCVRRDGDSDTIVAGSPTLIHDLTAHRELDARLI